MTHRDFTPSWQSWHEYIGKTGLFMRGWTEALIRDHLPPPEERGGNLATPRNGDTNPYWKLTTVERIEDEPAIANALAGIDVAAQARIEMLRADYYSQVHEDDGLSLADEDARSDALMQEADGLSFEDEDAGYNYYVQPREEDGLPVEDEGAWYAALIQAGCYGLSIDDSDDARYDELTDDDGWYDA